MATGTITLTVTGSNKDRVDAQIYYSYTSGTGSTSLTCTLRTRLKSGMTASTYDNQATWSMTINGTKYTTGSPGSINYKTNGENWQNLITKTVTISHTAAKSITVSGEFDINSSYISGASGSGTITLPATTLPVTFNGNTVNKITFNGQAVTHLVFNGTTIF